MIRELSKLGVLDRAACIMLAGAMAATPAHAAALGSPSVQVAAAPAVEPASADDPPAATDDGLAEAKARHLEADAKYNTADYEGAIEAWQKAFAALPRTAEANTYRSIILYDIAAAREKLFVLRGDVEHLKQARILLVQFETSIDEIYAGELEEGEQVRAEVQAKIARIDELIAQAERDDGAAKPPAAVPPTSDPQPATNTDAPPPARDPSRGLLIGGGVLLGLGLVAGAGMTAALVIGKRANDLDGLADNELDARKERFDRGRHANAGAIAAGVLGAAFVAAGVALIVVGTKRRASRTAFAPVAGRGLAGFSVSGRF
jgi:hypothetical protein